MIINFPISKVYSETEEEAAAGSCCCRHFSGHKIKKNPEIKNPEVFKPFLAAASLTSMFLGPARIVVGCVVCSTSETPRTTKIANS